MGPGRISAMIGFAARAERFRYTRRRAVDAGDFTFGPVRGAPRAFASFQPVLPMLRSLAALLIFQCLGESVSYVFSLPVPGPVIGMLLLFAFAMMRPASAEAIEPTALELLRHLSLLFIPAGVGIMVSAQTVRGEALAVIVSLVVSTTLGIAVTALVTQALLRRQRRHETAGEGAS